MEVKQAKYKVDLSGSRNLLCAVPRIMQYESSNCGLWLKLKLLSRDSLHILFNLNCQTQLECASKVL